jgi:ATP synthase
MVQVLFNAVLENACSELGARMSAMDSSSRNAGDMLDRLTLTYNRFALTPPPPLSLSHTHTHTHTSEYMHTLHKLQLLRIESIPVSLLYNTVLYCLCLFEVSCTQLVFPCSLGIWQICFGSVDKEIVFLIANIQWKNQQL